MRRTITIALTLALVMGARAASAPDHPVWPPPPDDPRVEYLGEIRCDKLGIESGVFGKIKRLIGGRSDLEKVELPFDVLVRGRSLFMTCQNLPALVRVDLDAMSYRLFANRKYPFAYPIALCNGGDALYITDSENKAVYRFADGRVEPLITEGLVRPTGIAALPGARRLYVVDTGDHTVKIFDFEGTLIRTVGDGDSAGLQLSYPTFAAGTPDGAVLINDALNYRITRIDVNGDLLSAFGEEGNGPGTFARPKGVAVDGDGHVYVVDNIFDNVQVFDADGRILLIIGAGGRESGEFWSPGGIDIVNDTIYVADTYNNRVQVLRYLGGGDE